MKLSMRLMRAGKAVSDCVQERDFEEIPCDQPSGGRLFIASANNTPAWRKYLQRMTSRSLGMINHSSSAILFVSVSQDDGSTNLVAITFGSGHHAINPDAIEREFGLRVVLNSVPRGEIVSIDAATPDATTFQRRIQASRKTDISAFGVDVERDLLRVAAGTPKDSTFAVFVAGRDALTIHTRVAPQDLPAKLKECVRLSRETTYRADFDWIDNVRLVRDNYKIEQLEALLFAEIQSIRSGQPSDLHASPPEIQDYTEGRLIAYYGPSMNSAKNWYPRLDVSDYVTELNDVGFNGDIESLKRHFVHVHDDQGAAATTKWRVLDCLVWDTVYQNQDYVLFAGNWYQVDTDFAKAVESDFAALLQQPAFIPSTTAKNERQFIAVLTQDPDYINLDQTKLSPAGVKAANIEFSDFLSRGKMIIHLKDGHSSSAISHLWNQGVVCGDTFASDREFRKKLRAAVRKREGEQNKHGFVDLLPLGKARIDTSPYTIAYGILRRRNVRSGKLDLPFFSKISLRPAARLLAKLGYTVKLHLIEKN